MTRTGRPSPLPPAPNLSTAWPTNLCVRVCMSLICFKKNLRYYWMSVTRDSRIILFFRDYISFIFMINVLLFWVREDISISDVSKIHVGHCNMLVSLARIKQVSMFLRGSRGRSPRSRRTLCSSWRWIPVVVFLHLGGAFSLLVFFSHLVLFYLWFFLSLSKSVCFLKVWSV